ncbi:hypothetical protein [Streptomyces murinus]|uniref:hypothetical protein n=1 Tax=Streptomyces murinus TaxID=33900 RepID=UPI003807B0E9
MHTIEYEAKVLGIDPDAMAERIKAAGGIFQGERLMRRYVYDTVPPVRGRWVRLRDSGGAVTLCVKTISSDEIDGTRETETTVGSFDDTHALLGLMGLTHRSYQENRRSSWRTGARPGCWTACGWRLTRGRVSRPTWRSRGTTRTR